MSKFTQPKGDARGMLRSRKVLWLLLLSGIVFISLYHLIHRSDGLEKHLLDGHHAHEENESLVPVSSLSHPVYKLIREAESELQELKSRQSRSLSDAVTEYRRRYKIPPPPNFDKWYAFATERGVELIDEYDTIYHSLLPFWALDPAVIRERTREMIGFDNAMIAVLIRDGKITKVEGGGEMYTWHREATPLMLKRFLEHLPDMDLAFNIRDEPRVVLTHDLLLRHVKVAKDESMPKAYNNTMPRNSWSPPASDLGDGNRIKEYKITRFNEFAHQPTWSNSRLSCSIDSSVGSCLNDSCFDNTTTYTSLPLGFIQNTTAFSDICNSPSMERTYGFFDRPNAFAITHELFPIFSQSKISSFQDILYPSPWYYVGRVTYDAARDMPWEEKASNLYWRGGTTGGFSRDGGWRRQHRQRFLSKIMPVGTARVLQYDDSTTATGFWHEKEARMEEMSKYFDVHFTNFIQCDPGDCDAQREYFGQREPVNMFDAFGSKYLLDIDGNAFSGRYYAWLLSNSLVYKLAVFREWHDEWLKPWVHYVPLGLKGEEYVESIRYFDQEELGKVQAKRLAEQSREWAQKVLRNDDMEVWYFRLLLEYGRLIDDNRYTIGFSV